MTASTTTAVAAVAAAPLCSICLDSFSFEATLDGCAHRFCLACIRQWSQTTNLCPQCKAEFLQIRQLHVSPDAAPRGTKRRNGRDASVIDVRPKKQRADYDEDELRRLGYVDDADDDDDDATDDTYDSSDSAIRVQSRARGYSTRDGFVVRDDDPIEYSDDDGDDDDDNDDDGDDDEDESESDDNGKGEKEIESDDIVILRHTRHGVEIPLRGSLRSVRIH